jgi:hypothetical protein
VGRDDGQRRGGAAAARPLARRDADGRVHLALAVSLHPDRSSRPAFRPALALPRALQHQRDRRVLCSDAGGALGGAVGGRGSHCSCPYPYSASASSSPRSRGRHRRRRRRRHRKDAQLPPALVAIDLADNMRVAKTDLSAAAAPGAVDR